MARKKETDVKAPPTHYMRLGDEQSDRVMEETSQSGELKLANASGANMVVLLSPDFIPERLHWLQTESGKQSYPCGLHLEARRTGDYTSLLKGFGADVCPFCELNQRYIQDAKKQDNEYMLTATKEVLKKTIGAETAIKLIAVVGDADKTTKSGTTVYTPVFSAMDPGVLTVTRAAFDFLIKQTKAEGIKGGDLPGLPINFIRGKKNAKDTFSQVTAIEFYPKHRLKTLPDESTLPTLERYGVYQPEVADKLLKLVQPILDAAIIQIGGGAPGRTR